MFTRRFDRIVHAERLSVGFAAERAWRRFMDLTLERRTAWELEALEHAAQLRSQLPGEVLQSTLVTLLVDHSGSMRGERMLLAAAAVDVARSLLVHLGVSVEILGFTTTSWKGGWSRRLWRWTGARKNPGRLCDLLHIVYCTADDHRPGSGARCLAHMLDPQLLKENVDGEAILWAASRQDRRPQRHKILLVISDGAPVDDSTLLENGPEFLVDHLRQVVRRLQSSRLIAQLQIGREADSPFAMTRRVEALSELGAQLIRLLGDSMQALHDRRCAVEVSP